MDMYGHMVPDPDCKWGLNFVVPHNVSFNVEQSRIS